MPFHSLSGELLVVHLFQTVVLCYTSNSYFKRFSLIMNEVFLGEVAKSNDLLTPSV